MKEQPTKCIHTHLAPSLRVSVYFVSEAFHDAYAISKDIMKTLKK